MDITVTTVGGTSAFTANDHYTYVTNFPTVTSLSQSSGAMAGGAILTITGSSFGTPTAGFHATKVAFGSTNVTTTPCPTNPSSACFNVLQETRPSECSRLRRASLDPSRLRSRIRRARRSMGFSTPT